MENKMAKQKWRSVIRERVVAAKDKK